MLFYKKTHGWYMFSGIICIFVKNHNGDTRVAYMVQDNKVYLIN